jgi:hypothetical protein
MLLINFFCRKYLYNHNIGPRSAEDEGGSSESDESGSSSEEHTTGFPITTGKSARKIPDDLALTTS